MNRYLFDIALITVLLLLNGLFAMSEMALSASRKARLQVMVESGEPGAAAAMELHENPTKFLSTVQIGITSIGILNGIVGEAAWAYQHRPAMSAEMKKRQKHRHGLLFVPRDIK